MAKKSQETADEKKYFVLFETDEEGIRQFQSCSDQDRSGAMLSKMCIEGKMVPALKLEVKPYSPVHTPEAAHCNKLILPPLLCLV